MVINVCMKFNYGDYSGVGDFGKSDNNNKKNSNKNNKDIVRSAWGSFACPKILFQQ